ncbi:MAG: polyphosphate polymerase domain-containing protein [Thermoguttaceae bacterium]|jgi:hypothetical protein
MGRTGRYELKYVIDEERATAIADYLRCYLQPSVHNGDGPVRGHPVISLYMDSPDFFLFRQAFFGHLNRMKLRIRFYNEHWQHPAFLEIKRRVMDVIVKDRAMISREGVRQFLEGGWPNQAYWFDSKELLHGKRRMDVYYKFWHFCNTIQAEGKVYVSYLREIWEAPGDEELRVTFDRQVSATPYDGSSSGRLEACLRGIPPPPERPPYLLPFDGVILELKYDTQAPWWMYDMVRFFNLQRRFMCKYSACIDGMQLQWRKAPLPEEEWPLMLHGFD